MKKKVQIIDIDLWEKLFLSLIILGIFALLPFFIKFSSEELSFNDVLIKTMVWSLLIGFQMSSASIGAFIFIALLIYFKTKASNVWSYFSTSMKSYFLLFVGVVIISFIGNYWFELNIFQHEFSKFMWLLGFVVGIIIHFIGKYI